MLPLVALAIYIESGGPIFFRQERVGHKGHEFELLKFRSMVQDAEKNGPQWAKQGDSRVTRVGRFIRKTRLDEIPQLFNVFKGEMSLVGPRPERDVFCKMLEEKIPFFNLRHSVRPGLTGWAQVNGLRGETDTFEKMRKRIEHDLYYVENWSLGFDLKIIVLTAFGAAKDVTTVSELDLPDYAKAKTSASGNDMPARTATMTCLTRPS